MGDSDNGTNAPLPPPYGMTNNDTDAFAPDAVPSALDALAKAKAIAAKLAQTPAPQDTSFDNISSLGGGGISGGGGAPPLTSKRKRWSSDPMGGDDDGDGDKRSRLALLGEDKVSKKVWIPVDKNPGYNYVGLLIGPGGSKQKALQTEAGGRVKIQVRGKGSNGSHNVNMNSVQKAMDEPLHVLLEGDKECVDKAEQLINELLQDTAKADAEKRQQLAEMGIVTGSNPSAPKNGDGAGALVGDISGLGSPAAITNYKPVPVAQLIGGGGIYGPGSSTEMLEEKMGIPNGVVGYIIGKGGESITSMQRRTGCRVQIQKEHEMTPGTNTRIITLSAALQDQITQCRTIIEQMVEERQRLNAQQQTTPQNGTVQLQQALAQGQKLVTVQVPDADVGLIIGKGGVNIRSMQDRSGANIQIPPQADVDNPLVRTCSITHPTLDGANFAKQMIEDILRNKTGMGGGTFGSVTGSNEQSIQVLIPDKDVGMVIGRSGCVIREMQSKTRTRIQIPSQPTPGQQNRVATVSGSMEGCQQVKQMIERMIMEQSSQSVMTGTNFTSNFMQPQMGGMGQVQYGQGATGYMQQPGSNMYGGHYGQYQQQYQTPYQGYATQPATAATHYQPVQQGAVAGASGQKTDYSAEWAAYFAAQAAQQGTTASGAAPAAATTSTPAAAPASSPTSAAVPATSAPAPAAAGDTSTPNTQDPTAYYDAFWRYAHYYGEEAARKYYGAWSPPAGTPNPYAQSGGAAQPAQQQDNSVKDSSARKLSNLPAWMTKS